MITTREAAKVIYSVIQQLFEHGWAEDYQYHIEYNDTDKILEVIEYGLTCANRHQALKYCGRFEWDKEANLKEDDGGLFSFAYEVGNILKQDKLVGPVNFEKEVTVTKSDKACCPFCQGNVTTLLLTYITMDDIQIHNTAIEVCSDCNLDWFTPAQEATLDSRIKEERTKKYKRNY